RSRGCAPAGGTARRRAVGGGDRRGAGECAGSESGAGSVGGAAMRGARVALITPALFSQPSTRPCRGEEGVVSLKTDFRLVSCFSPSLPGRGGWRAGREGLGSEGLAQEGREQRSEVRGL